MNPCGHIQPFVFEKHYTAVACLWQRVFGDVYPVSERVLSMRLGYRDQWEPGDEQIVLDGQRAIAFGQVDFERHADPNRPPTGRINLFMVDPAYRRQGHGRRLLEAMEKQIRQAGGRTIEVGGFLNRFWSGIPEDLPEAHAFLEKRGYKLAHTVHDLIVDLTVGPPPDDDEQRMRESGLSLESAAPDDLPALMEFEHAEFAGWIPSLIAMIRGGDLSNVLVMKDAGVICGSIQTFTPASRWRGPNLVWDAIFGERLGGYGAVGIGEKWRGRGMGLMLCRGAQRHLRANNASHALIDWTGLIDFYARVGARPWKRFLRGELS